ncbi:MAG: energy-coupling factor transporter transrane protein EcfT [Magnetococcales bacterium]|nr:energy-coupling factor transporter transrane protein EcfT [Magnetococcales bacterium]HIJ85497.1 hypothetical protein [Magnetococcales bacterium]
MTGKQHTFSNLPAKLSFLRRCDPRSRLAAFFLVLPVLTHGDSGAMAWWLVLLALVALPRLAGMGWGDFLLPLRRLRFFFLVLFLVHGFFVPGSALLPFSEWPSREGLLLGGQQMLRLACMASLAWVLVRVSSPQDMVLGLCGLFGILGRMGVPVMRWAVLLSWTLECVGRLFTLATSVRARVIPDDKVHQGWWGAVTLSGQRASLFLTDMMVDMVAQEQRLVAQGVLTGLPMPPPVPYRPEWRDILLLFSSGMIIILFFQDA